MMEETENRELNERMNKDFVLREVRSAMPIAHALCISLGLYHGFCDAQNIHLKHEAHEGVLFTDIPIVFNASVHWAYMKRMINYLGPVLEEKIKEDEASKKAREDNLKKRIEDVNSQIRSYGLVKGAVFGCLEVGLGYIAGYTAGKLMK